MGKKSKIIALSILIIGLLVLAYNNSIHNEGGVEKSIEKDVDAEKDKIKSKKDTPAEDNSNESNLEEESKENLKEKSEKKLWKETWNKSEKESWKMDKSEAKSQCNVYKTCIEGCENTPLNEESKGKGVQIESKELNYSNDKVEVNIKFPKIQWKGELKGNSRIEAPIIKEDIALKINKEIEDYTMAFKNNIEKGAAKYKEKCDNSGNKFNVQVAKSDYKVTYNSDNILSILIEYYEYTGGAHGMTYKINFNYYIDTGDKINLSSLFKEGFNYKEKIDESIKESMSKHPEIYFEDKFQGINDDTSFYITKEGVVIYFPLYEIAPYSTGIPEFTLSL